MTHSESAGAPGSPMATPFVTIAILAVLVAPASAATNNPPVISGKPPQFVKEKASYAFTPTARDPNGDSLSFWLENRPRWMRINSATGKLTGTPSFEDAGVYRTIKLRVGDGHGGQAVLGPFAVTVEDVNRAPTIYGYAARNIAERSRYSFTPNATDPDGDKLTFGISGKPRWAAFNKVNGTLSGTPSYDDAATYPGIAISVSDGSATVALPKFSITVRNTNRPPLISGTPRTSVRETKSYAFKPWAKDPDGDGLYFSATNLPPWARLDWKTGAITGTPGYADQGRYGGITLTVNDGKGGIASLAPFSVVVENLNRAPTIAGTPSPRAIEGGRYRFIPEAQDADGDKLTFSIAGKPRWASFNKATGKLSGVPPQGSRGFYENIRISVADGADVVQLDPFSIYVYNDGQGEGPRGFYSLDYVVPLPFVDGVVMRKAWADVEPQDGVYDFSHIEESIRQAEAVGQKVVLFYLTEKAPSWLRQKSETFMNNGQRQIVPWDETMLEELRQLAFTVARYKIDGIPLREHPALAYVHASIGGIKHIRLHDLPKGYTPELFASSVLRSVRIWENAFPETSDLIVGLFENVADGTKNPSTAENLRERLLQEFNGVNRSRVNFFEELLTGTSPKLEVSHGKLLQGVDGRSGICFQSCGPWAAQNDAKYQQCNWAKPVDMPEYGIEHGYYDYGARYFELYPGDLKHNFYYNQFLDWHQRVHE